ncbi:transposase [Micromonospora sp. NPDC048999]|uniref:RNA-guided endonuclease InsQ/TnpB family protein n=1 Tax=Micromonospora sp. NPDC048999 TaxID=3155391 RepID=UPI0033F4BB77
MEEAVRYTYRLRLGATAVAALTAEWHRCRWLWNEAVHQQTQGNRPTATTLHALLTEARACSAWLREGSVVAQQQVLRDYAQALTASFKVKGRGRPVRKARKKTRPSLNYTQRGFSIRNGRLCLPGKVVVPVVWSRDLPADPTSVRVYQDSLGHWYASFVTRREPARLPDADGGIGIDWGVKTVANTTDPGFDLPHPEYGRRAARALATAQRRMARRAPKPGQKASRGYRRARLEAAKVYAKTTRQRQDTARKWAKRVVENHAVIAVEDFKPKFLTKTSMARKAADGAIGATKRELIDRGKRAGRKVVPVPPAYTTMTCANCHARAKQRLVLSERIFRCESCDHVADRDRNAARVILASAGLNRAGADGVRRVLDSFGVDAVLPEPGIPRL